MPVVDDAVGHAPIPRVTTPPGRIARVLGAVCALCIVPIPKLEVSIGLPCGRRACRKCVTELTDSIPIVSAPDGSVALKCPCSASCHLHHTALYAMCDPSAAKRLDRRASEVAAIEARRDTARRESERRVVNARMGVTEVMRAAAVEWICDGLLTRSCGNCFRILGDFEGCLAVSCDPNGDRQGCGWHFCAICGIAHQSSCMAHKHALTQCAYKATATSSQEYYASERVVVAASARAALDRAERALAELDEDDRGEVWSRCAGAMQIHVVDARAPDGTEWCGLDAWTRSSHSERAKWLVVEGGRGHPLADDA